MRAKTFAATLAATAALLALTLPASSPAATHFYRRPALVDAELQLRGTNGFQFFASTFGRTDLIAASKRASKLGGVSVNYFTPPHRGRPSFSAGVLTMGIGRLGRFHGRFVVKKTETHKPTGDCVGDPTTIEKGVFVGSFNFHGERGYSVIDADREPGTVTRQGASRCPIPAEHPGREARQGKREEKAEAHEAHLIAGDDKYRVLFQANSESESLGSPLTYFQASVSGGRAGPFQVSSSAFLIDFHASAAATFQTPGLGEPPSEATVKPPAPFSGAATFQLETPTTASWTGDLAVELPGLGKVPLTGGKIAAGLCHGPAHCTKTLPKALQPLIEVPDGTAIAIGTKHGS